MLTWMLVNVLLGLLALGFITLNATAPHRLRFLAAFAALVAWLVPWPALPEMLPVNLFSLELWRMERVVEAGSTRLTGVAPLIVQAGALPLARGVLVLDVLELCLAALTLVGGALFARQFIAHHLLLRRLQQTGSDGHWLWSRSGLRAACPVVVQHEISGAFSSGLLHPRIWVHADLAQSPQLATLLGHELTHLRQHDNWYLLAITLAENLLWWNPLARYLGSRSRELLELSCDERCQASIPDYPARLAELMLDTARGGQQPRVLALGANIFDTPNPNIQRLKLLQRSYPMLTRHVVSAAVTAAIAVASVGFVTAQPEPAAGQRIVIQRQIVDEAGEVKTFVLQEGAADAGVGVAAAAPEAGAVRQIRLQAGINGPDGAVDQMLKLESNGEEQFLTFSFTDAPLPIALSPLANLLAGPGMMLQAAGAADPAAASFPMSPNLKLEFPAAAERRVTASATALPLDEAISLLAVQSGCNIFRDGADLVVDWCE